MAKVTIIQSYVLELTRSEAWKLKNLILEHDGGGELAGLWNDLREALK
jgi:hypothetical protein